MKRDSDGDPTHECYGVGDTLDEALENYAIHVVFSRWSEMCYKERRNEGIFVSDLEVEMIKDGNLDATEVIKDRDRMQQQVREIEASGVEEIETKAVDVD